MSSLPDRTGRDIELSTRQGLSSDPGLHVYTPPPGDGLHPYPPGDGLHPYPPDPKPDLPWEKSTPSYAYSPSFPGDHRPLIPASPAPPSEPPRRILGLKRPLFYILLASLFIVLIIGIATGVGVGVAMNSPATPTPSTTTPATTTRVLPAPVATSTTSPTDLIQCPGANLTLYASRVDLEKRFLVLCGRDYHSNEGSHDLLSRDAETMAECIDYCAGREGCVGAGWGYQQGRYVCWLKSRLGEGRGAGSWCFAVLEEGG